MTTVASVSSFESEDIKQEPGFGARVALHDYDQQRSPVEQQLVICARLLAYLCDGARARDGMGYSMTESAFGKSIASCRKLLTPAQIRPIYKIICNHTAQLASFGMVPPTPAEIESLCASKGGPVGGIDGQVRTNKIVLDLADHMITLKFPRKTELWVSKAQAIRQYVRKLAQDGRLSVDLTEWLFFNTETFAWQYPFDRQVWEMVTNKEYFPVYNNESLELTPAAARYLTRLEEEALDSMLREQQVQEAKLAEAMAMIDVIGGLDVELAPGMHFFQHQKDDIPLLVQWKYACLGHQMGLGKTLISLYAAKALHRTQGYRIFVVATVSGQGAWRDAAEMLNVPIELFTWRSIPPAKDMDGEYIDYGNFVFIPDEAHGSQSLPPYAKPEDYVETKEMFRRKGGSQQAAKFAELALHPQCKACFPATGTPMPNGRPANEIAILLAVRHPLIYSDDQVERIRKRKDFEKKFCNAGPRSVGKITIPWDVTGAAYLDLLHKLTIYKPGRETNREQARIIRRLKTECLDLPPKMRIWDKAEISPDAAKAFDEVIESSWERYEHNVQAKLEAERVRYTEEKGLPPSEAYMAAFEERMRLAEALAELTFLRHASSRAKADYVIGQALSLIRDEGQPVVIFTEFKDAAQRIARKLHEGLTDESALGISCVPIISGEVTGEKRQEIIRDFQRKDSPYKAIVCMHRAASESITLTRASYMFLVDRPWTPGRAEQSEDRIHRISQSQKVTIYWVQMPQEISGVDVKCDKIVTSKATNINKGIEGKALEGMEFATLGEFDETRDAKDVLASLWAERKGTKISI